MELYVTKKINVKKLLLSVKVSDLGIYTLFDNDNNEIVEHNGYKPSFIPGRSDTIVLEIDLDTGKILNFLFDKDKIQEFIAEH